MMAKNAVIVISPSPPIWTRHRITICPKRENSVPVSLTTRPVTHVAEVAVKRASIKEIGVPFGEASGIASKIVPTKITVRKLRGIANTECSRKKFITVNTEL